MQLTSHLRSVPGAALTRTFNACRMRRFICLLDQPEPHRVTALLAARQHIAFPQHDVVRFPMRKMCDEMDAALGAEVTRLEFSIEIRAVHVGPRKLCAAGGTGARRLTVS